ncbi:MAG: lysophospholipid acyltransferase family protein, partial [Patescibacteria group bacterium]|nr:lysophospholipid acyltransferase family protein [Patescibacteria group bacterium]
MQFLKALKNQFRAIVSGLILSIVIRLLKLTLRIEIEGKEYVEDAKRQGKGIIYVFWHGQMLVPMMVHTGLGVPVMVSKHADGELIAYVLRFLGYSLVRGSSTRGGRKALIEMTHLLRDNREVAITPDGPSGPHHECKTGTVILAAHTGTPIIPVTAIASHFFLLKSWDRFQFVLPWSRCVLQYGAPLVFARYTQPEQVKKATYIVENTLE